MVQEFQLEGFSELGVVNKQGVPTLLSDRQAFYLRVRSEQKLGSFTIRQIVTSNLSPCTKLEPQFLNFIDFVANIIAAFLHEQDFITLL